MKINFLFISTLFCAINTHAVSYSNSRCYVFNNANTPENIGLPKELIQKNDIQNWCYLTVQAEGHDFSLFYKFDNETLQIEQSGLLQRDSAGNPESLSIGLASRGKITFQKLPSLELNPFQVPLTAIGIKRSAELKSAIFISKNEIEILFANLKIATELNRINKIQEGEFEDHVPDHMKPFNSPFWNHVGLPMASGEYSPLGIYDDYIKARTGQSPGAVQWEEKNHSDTTAPWGGHCNGWAAASALYPEPTKTLVDPITHKIISPYAQKGMLAEASFCVNWAFYGSRNYEQAGDDPKDIHPALFHKVIQYYLNKNGRPVALDYMPDHSVDNNVATGYKFSIIKKDEHTFHVNAELTMFKYDQGLGDDLGTAEEYIRPYAYTLTTDQNGEIISGEWDANVQNPDYVWVPLNPVRQCGWKNPNIDPFKVVELINSLPEAKPINIKVNRSLERTLAPNEVAAIAFDEIRGVIKVINLDINTSGAVEFISTGKNRYPIRGDEERRDHRFLMSSGKKKITFNDNELVSLEKMELVNPTAVPQTVSITIESVEKLGD